MEEEGRQRAQDALELTRRQEEDDAMRRAHAGAHYFLNRFSVSKSNLADSSAASGGSPNSKPKVAAEGH